MKPVNADICNHPVNEYAEPDGINNGSPGARNAAFHPWTINDADGVGGVAPPPNSYQSKPTGVPVVGYHWLKSSTVTFSGSL